MSRTHTDNILAVYRQADDAQREAGFTWYSEAHALAYALTPRNVWQGAGLLAAYSPLTPWWRNVELAIDSVYNGEARTDTLGNSARAAARILAGEHPLDVLKGVKTRAFASNIALNGVSDDVTVDVHAYSIAVGVATPSSRLTMGVRLYREIADSYREAAREAGIPATGMQAVTWVVWRDLHPKAAARKVV